MQAFSLSESKTLKILTNFLCINWKIVHDHIWKKRCDLVIEWEKSKGISIEQKRTSSKSTSSQLFLKKNSQSKRSSNKNNGKNDTNNNTNTPINSSYGNTTKNQDNIKNKILLAQQIETQVKKNTLSKIRTNMVQHWSQWRKKLTWKGNTWITHRRNQITPIIPTTPISIKTSTSIHTTDNHQSIITGNDKDTSFTINCTTSAVATAFILPTSSQDKNERFC